MNNEKAGRITAENSVSLSAFHIFCGKLHIIAETDSRSTAHYEEKQDLSQKEDRDRLSGLCMYAFGTYGQNVLSHGDPVGLLFTEGTGTP